MSRSQPPVTPPARRHPVWGQHDSGQWPDDGDPRQGADYCQEASPPAPDGRRPEVATRYGDHRQEPSLGGEPPYYYPAPYAPAGHDGGHGRYQAPPQPEAYHPPQIDGAHYQPQSGAGNPYADRGADRVAGSASRAQPYPGVPDPQAYDLSSYHAPGMAPQQGYAQTDHRADHRGDFAHYEQHGREGQGGLGYPGDHASAMDPRQRHFGDGGQQPFGQQSYGHLAYGQPVLGQQPLGHGQQAFGNLDYGHGPDGNLPVREGAYDEAYEEYEDEAPRKGRRVWLLTLALIGSIAVGGGLAFGYKQLVGNEGKSGTSVVRAGTAPARVAPSDPGGRKVAGADSKLMGRLEAERAGAGQSDQGVRKVSTFVVGPDGKISPAAPSAARVETPAALDRSSGPSSRGQGSSVPGFEIVEGFGSAPATPKVETAQSRPLAQPGPIQPKVITVSPSADRLPPEATERPRVAVRKVTTLLPDTPETGTEAEVVAKRKPMSAARAPVRPAAAPQGGNRGYVAVLSSKGSRMAALQVFADMREKYPSVLSGKIPDVQKSDQSDRGLGVVYRSVVGPPGSRQGASDLCRQLKQAGHGECWVTAY